MLSGVQIGTGAKVCGHGWIYGRGRIHIGADTWLSPGVIIYTHLLAPVSIGNRCDIGPGVQFIPGSHAIGPASRRAGKGTARPIAIGDGCWIGAGARIMGGVTIGDGSIIASGAVVTHDVQENTLAAGVPARAKKQLPLDI